MFLFKKIWPYFILLIVVVFFFSPVLKGQIPFSGDYLISQNPYSTSSFLGYAPGGYPNKAQGIDVAHEIYPWRYFSINQLKNFQIPFWNPYNFSGNPLFANFQSAVFYPFNFFYFLFSFNYAWTILIMLQPFLAAVFMYIFLTRGLNLSKTSGILGGIAFGFSSYMTVWIEYGNIGNTFMWLPLILFLTKQLLFGKRSINFLFLTLSFVFCFLAGYIQGFFYVVTVSILFLFFLFFTNKQLKKTSLVLFFLSLLVSFLITLPQSLATIQLFLVSTRYSYTLDQIAKSLLPLFYPITFFFPDFFGNPASRNYWIDGTYIERVMYISVALILFLFYGVKKNKSKEKLFFLILAIFSFVITLNLPFMNHLYRLPIPVISTTVPTRELSIFIFSTIVLSAMGIDYWLKNKNKTSIPFFYLGVYLVCFVAVSILGLVKLFPANELKITLRNMILPLILAFAITLVFFIKAKYKKLAITLLFLFLVFDLFYFFNKITPFSPQELIYPKTPITTFLKNNAGINRFWGYGSAYIPSNFQTVDGIFSPEGNDPLHLSRYGELLASSKDGKLPILLPRPDANIASGFGKENLSSNYFRKRVLDLLGVKYILNLKNDSGPDLTTFPEKDYKLIWQNLPWQVYKNLNALPRFFLTNNYIIEKNKSEVLKKIYDPNIDLSKTLILEENPRLPIDKFATGSVKLVTYTPNEVIFETKTTGNMLFFLSDNLFPNWRTYIGPSVYNLQFADYTFRAIAVPKGHWFIGMKYSPGDIDFSWKIAVSGVILFVIVYLTLDFYEKKK